MGENKIIDSHSHIGIDYLWGKAEFEKYIELLEKQSISIGLVMPVPGPSLIHNQNKRYFYWDINKQGKIIYNSDVYSKLINPYKEINEHIFNKIKLSKSGLRIEFIPMIHPIIDTCDYLEYIKDKYKPLALKIHGIGGGYGPGSISNETIKVLKKLDLPLIIHTDYSNNSNDGIDYLRNINTPYKWAEFILKHELKGYLTHGCRLDSKTFNLVNKNDNLVIGIGPDIKINNERFRWVENCNNKEYLEIIRDQLDHNKILFDLDYSWNVIDKDKNIDNSAVNRISSFFPKKEKEKILSRNAIKFFNIK